MTAPFWLDERHESPGRVGLAGEPDVVVIGGGVTGCAAALALARGGLRVRLHEARTVASGASGRNGGFALRGGAMPYDVARRELGAHEARSLWLLTQRSLVRMQELAGDAFRRTGSLRLAADERERTELEAEYEALRGDGFAVAWFSRLDGPLANRFFGAMRHPGDGSLQPGRWVRRLGALAAREGVEIVELSRVERLSDLTAPKILIATDGYTAGLIPELDAAVRPTRGQVVATEPLPRRLFGCPHYARRGYDYWQQTPDGRLVLGGWRDANVEAEYTAEEAVTPVVQGRIEAFARDLLGFAPRITHRWAGIFGGTDDRLPLAGRWPGDERVWVACGYSGHGNVLGLACGELVAEAILGRSAPELELFDPGRLLGEVSPDRKVV